MTGYAPRVQAGIEFLNERDPGWYWKVEPDLLAMGSAEDCVLGQLYGDFFDGVAQFGWAYGHHPYVGPDVYVHGFDVDPRDNGFSFTAYNQLNRLWSYAIRRLREMDKASW